MRETSWAFLGDMPGIEGGRAAAMFAEGHPVVESASDALSVFR